MKISINWLKEFVDLNGISESEIVKRFNLSTAEIEGVEYKGKDTFGVVFGKILEVNEHPNSKKLHVLKVDLGDRVEQIVCGASNVRKDMITCVATVGGKVCGKDIGSASLVGVESKGMCCGYSELGIGSDDTGIIDVLEDVRIGEDIKKVWPIDDVVFEIDNKTLTNRPDLWGHYGIARELACIFDRELLPLNLENLDTYNNLKKIDISVNTSGCLRYSAMSVDNVCKKTSPIKMMIRLNYAGMRDINLLADITNYVMLELGQPMHAFDNENVTGINVVNSKLGDKLLTLEGEEHEIYENSILIENQEHKPVAIAGIKGGLLDSITDKTKNVLFESATFDASQIRKTSRKIGLVTDASLRYEKSLDPEMTKIALSRIIKILKEIDSGVVVSSCFSDVYNKKYEPSTIKINEKFISNRIGEDIKKEQIVKILTKLDFEVCEENEDIIVKVPTFRATKDVSMNEDLVEEIARIYGYDNITPKPLNFEPKPIKLNRNVSEEYEVKNLLARKYGANEVHSYVWEYKDFNQSHNINSHSVVKLLDSSNAGQSGIRSELLPTLLKIVSENRNNFDDIKIFEIGRCAESLNEEKLVNEKKKLAVCFASQKNSSEELFENLKEFIFDYSKNNLSTQVKLIEGEKPNYMHPKNTFRIVDEQGIDYGYIGIVHPKTVDLIDKRLNIVCLELDFGEFCKLNGEYKKINIPSKFQTVNFDVSILVPVDFLYGDLAKILDEYKNEIVLGYKLKEIYESEIFKLNKSITISFSLVSYDHTLEGNEIDEFLQGLIAHLEKYNLKIRNN